jgi:serine/threonine protein phosphatase 1
MTYKPDIYIHNDDNSARFVLGNSIANPLIVIGINPSTADDITSDTTIRRVSGYAQINKFNGFIMLNVYPQRATNPNNLPKECDICLHKQNIAQIKKIFQTYSGATILVAFGNLIRKRIYLKQCFSDIVSFATNCIINWSIMFQHPDQ